ncbi:hypothetical protein TWF694_003274 [Orbilia ellipsospora]|uniref:Uncharacterized protein n=1 Tax=Orbilia ellipsospora TaxID=2528407 RepID=A0AAV9X295_9PEZI
MIRSRINRLLVTNSNSLPHTVYQRTAWFSPKFQLLSSATPAFNRPDSLDQNYSGVANNNKPIIRRYQSVAAIRAVEDINEQAPQIASQVPPPHQNYVSQFSNLAERIIDDFKLAEIQLTSYGVETLKKLYGDLSDQNITVDVMQMMVKRLAEFEQAREESGIKVFKTWVPANEPHTCGARFHTNSLRILKCHPRGMWEVLELESQKFGQNHWSMKVYWFLAYLIKADIIQRRELPEYHGDAEDEHMWGASRVKWRRLL